MGKPTVYSSGVGNVLGNQALPVGASSCLTDPPLISNCIDFRDGYTRYVLEGQKYLSVFLSSLLPNETYAALIIG